MNKRFMFLTVLAAFLLTGCQLAIPEVAQPAATVPDTGDRMIGMLVTMDAFEPYSTVNYDGLHLIPSQGKRIYAELREESYESYDGTRKTTHRMTFPEGLGLTFMGYEITPEVLPAISEDESYWTSTVDDGIRMEKNNFKTVNDESFVQLEAAIYVSDTASNLVLYMNPVYQNAAGEVYALGVAPTGYHGVSMNHCSVSYGTKLSESVNGEVVDEDSGYVKMTIRTVHLPDFYRIVQIDADRRIIKADDFLPAELPETYVPEGNCAYLILEAYAQGNPVKRSVKSPDDQDQALDVFYPMDNGICHPGYTQVAWEGAE